MQILSRRQELTYNLWIHAEENLYFNQMFFQLSSANNLSGGKFSQLTIIFF